MATLDFTFGALVRAALSGSSETKLNMTMSAQVRAPPSKMIHISREFGISLSEVRGVQRKSCGVGRNSWGGGEYGEK